jgi:hypothetical protein
MSIQQTAGRFDRVTALVCHGYPIWAPGHIQQSTTAATCPAPIRRSSVKVVNGMPSSRRAISLLLSELTAVTRQTDSVAHGVAVGGALVSVP